MSTAAQIWNELPKDIASDLCGQIGAALHLGGHEERAIKGIGRHLMDLIDAARGGPDGTFDRDAMIRLQILTWQWCANTAAARLSDGGAM